MARWREGADQILVVDGSGKRRVPSARRHCQAAMAHRTRLSGTQAGGRGVTCRRTVLARASEELEQEVRLGHFEGRGWGGFPHHATLCIAAYGFLTAERETIPPSGDRATTLFPQFALREGYQPRP